MKKSFLLLSFLLLATFSLSAQNFKRVDSIVKLYKHDFNSPKELAKQIRMDFQSDILQVRAIYTWMITHIRYDINEKDRLKSAYTTVRHKEKKKEKINKRLATVVISSRRAVHGGYAVLFSEMCNLLGIRSRIVNGMGKSKTTDIGKKVRVNHTWNIVEIYDKFFLIDTTWGAGSFTTKNGFINDPNYFYFLTEPPQFIANHYPKDYKNSLLDYLVPKEIFSKSPITYQSNSVDFDLLFPTEGYLIRNTNNHFVIETKKKVKEVFYLQKRKKVLVHNFKQTEKDISFDIDLTRVRLRDLVLYIDDAPVFGFKLKHPGGR